MKTKILIVLCVASLALMASASGVVAQLPDSMPDDKYHLANAKAHDVHANDHAILLRKYAAAHKSVPPEVLKEHTDALKFHLQSARRSYGKLSASAKSQKDLKNQAELLKQIDLIDKRLTKINEMVKKLETESAEASLVAAHSAAISRELMANRVANQSVDNDFYNMQSWSYYEEGLGHFAD